MDYNQHVTSTPFCNVPAVRTSRVKIKRPPEGFATEVNEYRPVYHAAPVVAAPNCCMRVKLSGTQPDLEALFLERYERQQRMQVAKAIRKAG